MWPILATLGEVFRGKTRKGCFTTVYVKDEPYGEIDPLFVHQFGEELFKNWLVYTGTHEHALMWNGQMDKPLIVNGWCEIQEFYDLKYKYHQVDFIYYGDGMFILKVDTDCGMDRRFFPDYHSVSIPDHDPLTFRVVVAGVDDGDSRQTLKIQPWYGEFISKYETEYLVLVGPSDDAYRLPIRHSESCKGGIELTMRWRKFCLDNGFSDGDVLQFTFRNILNSGWVDVIKVE